MYNSIYRSVFILFTFIVLLFVCVQVLFRYSFIDLGDNQFLLSTVISNAFIITSVFALSAAYNMISLSKKIQLGFRKVFKLTFIPGFLAGILSISLIFLYFNLADNQGMEMLKQEYFDYSKTQALEEGNFDEVSERISSPAVQNTNILSWRTFTLAFAAITFFNFSLSVMMAFLWKIKNPYQQIS